MTTIKIRTKNDTNRDGSTNTLPRIGRHDSVNVLPYLDLIDLRGSADNCGSEVRATTTKSGNAALLVVADETSDYRDCTVEWMSDNTVFTVA
jgi:hypothetical protein